MQKLLIQFYEFMSEADLFVEIKISFYYSLIFKVADYYIAADRTQLLF